jgi:lipopolysaccharide heptosyltransferase II
LIASLNNQATYPGRLPEWSTVNKVLLVRLRSIGDTILMTPCLEALKTFQPEINITALSEPLAAPILEDHPLVDTLLVIEPNFTSRGRLIKRLRHEKFDIAFNMHGGSTASFITRLSGARHTVGYAGHRYSSLLSARAPAPDVILGRREIHSVEQQLALLHWAGVPLPVSPQLRLQISKDAMRNVKKRLTADGLRPEDSQSAHRPFAIISPAAAFAAKQWAADKFAQVVDHLFENFHMPCWVIAASNQRAIADRVSALARSRPQVVTDMSLKELMALISLSSLFVGNDSGPMHIAAACQRPLVVIFGSSDATVWHPWTSAPHKTVGSRQYAVGSQEGNLETAINEVSVEAVTAAIDTVMERSLIKSNE